MTFSSESREARGPGWEERRDQLASVEHRWRVRSGEWAALALARHVFGEATTATLTPWPDPAPLRGALTLRVPFRALEDHRRRERVFLLLASRDEVVRQVPFLYVFEPVPLAAPPDLTKAPGPPAPLHPAPAPQPPPSIPAPPGVPAQVSP